MNYNNAGNYYASFDIITGTKSSQHDKVKPEKAKSSQSRSSKAHAFQKSYREAVAEVNREKNSIALQELENTRLRREEWKVWLSLLQKKEKPADPFDTLWKCLDIARRIMKGAKVTPNEIRFLVANIPELYFMAILFKQEKKDSDDDKTYSDEELQGDSSEADAETGTDSYPA